MLLKNHLLAKTLGWLLPLCFAASFLACLNNCSHDEGETVDIPAYHSTDVVSGLGECEGCPITALPIALAQRQSSVHSVAVGLEQFTTWFSATVSSRSNELITLPYRFMATSDPPLERLCVFRI
jgi:hypothetical protein